MAMWGLDLEQVERLAVKMEEDAGTIEGINSALTSMLGGTEWQGPDAERFRSDWETQFSKMLRDVVEALGIAARTARTNAQEQEQASNSSGSGGGGGGADRT